jgi:prepilin-type processing-associated H-X9-DG protein
MNIDLKLNSNIANGIIGNTAVYPNMPKFGAIRNPAATVLFTDVAFSPTLEAFTSSPSRNGIFPCNRWSAFSRRHNNGGTLAFTDGHSAVFKWDYVYNQNPTPSPRNEKLNPDVWWNPNRDIP